MFDEWGFEISCVMHDTKVSFLHERNIKCQASGKCQFRVLCHILENVLIMSLKIAFKIHESKLGG